MKIRYLVSWIIFAVLLAASVSTSAYNFPQPDWGSLLNERKAMINEQDLELYTEGSNAAVYYGAKLEPAKGVYLGATPEFSGDLMPLGAYLTYNEHNVGETRSYISQYIDSGKQVVMLGITITNLYDVSFDRLRETLDNYAAFKCPVFVRFANEMNCSSLGDEPDLYIDVFRKAANMIHEYQDFAVVWSPVDLGALDRPFQYYYPGDEYVDWVGISCYSLKHFNGKEINDIKETQYFMSGDNAWATNKIKPLIKFMEKYNINKPVMLSEGGTATSSNYDGDLQWWAAPRLGNYLWNVIMKYPQVKMINYFNVPRVNEVDKFDISGKQYAVDIFNTAKNSGAYIKEYGKESDFSFRKANDGETLVAGSDGCVNLYTLSYVPGNQDVCVTYKLDGVWYHSSNTIPYQCGMDISGMSDGAHTIEITNGSQSKSYTFYKSGKAVCFGAEPDASVVAAQNNKVYISINGNMLNPDVPAKIINDRTLVPLRSIFEALGASVSWDGENKIVTAVKGDIIITIQIGNKTMNVNSRQKELDVPAQIIDNRTLVPARAISEALGCKVDWDSGSKTVYITEKAASLN